jgi:hypothetical protein
MTYDRSVNDDAIRLREIDETLLYIMRNAAALGLGANAVSASLRAEKDEIRERLMELGHDLVPLGDRPTKHVGGKAREGVTAA